MYLIYNIYSYEDIRWGTDWWFQCITFVKYNYNSIVILYYLLVYVHEDRIDGF